MRVFHETQHDTGSAGLVRVSARYEQGFAAFGHLRAMCDVTVVALEVKADIHHIVGYLIERGAAV